MSRFLDIIISLFALIFLSPIIISIAILVRIRLGRPILFIQCRPGLNKVSFNFYKFRSMSNELDIDGNFLPNEERLTTFGKWLRRNSLDELPSLINVLKGDMSLVGPRPLRLKYNDFYTQEQEVRHTVKPGITGWAQINGRTAISWDEKFEFDIEYVQKKSVLFDLQILCRTLLVVLKKENTSPRHSNFEIPFDEYVRRKHGAKG